MKGNKPRCSRRSGLRRSTRIRVSIDRLARAATGICGFYSIMPRAAPVARVAPAAPEYKDALHAFLAKRSRYGKHR